MTDFTHLFGFNETSSDLTLIGDTSVVDLSAEQYRMVVNMMDTTGAWFNFAIVDTFTVDWTT